MKNNIYWITGVSVLVIDCYIATNSLRTIPAATSCVVVDEILNANSLPTNKHWVHLLNFFYF